MKSILVLLIGFVVSTIVLYHAFSLLGYICVFAGIISLEFVDKYFAELVIATKASSVLLGIASAFRIRSYFAQRWLR
jgi:hypothetical protein